MRKWLKITLLFVALVALAFGGYEIALQSAYARVESLTRRYGTAVQPVLAKALDKEGKWEDGAFKVTLVYLKVFDVAPDSAKVFVVTDFDISNARYHKVINRQGEFKYLMYQGGSWQVDAARPTEVIWSWDSTALIEGNTWPPYH
jgi:hypothetical protein